MDSEVWTGDRGTRSRNASPHHPHLSELAIAFFEQLLCAYGREFAKLAREIRLQGVRHSARVVVCPAQGFREDVVDHAELLEVRRGQAQCAGRTRFRFVRGHLGPGRITEQGLWEPTCTPWLRHRLDPETLKV